MGRQADCEGCGRYAWLKPGGYCYQCYREKHGHSYFQRYDKSQRYAYQDAGHERELAPDWHEQSRRVASLEEVYDAVHHGEQWRPTWWWR